MLIFKNIKEINQKLSDAIFCFKCWFKCNNFEPFKKWRTNDDAQWTIKKSSMKSFLSLTTQTKPARRLLSSTSPSYYLLISNLQATISTLSNLLLNTKSSFKCNQNRRRKLIFLPWRTSNQKRKKRKNLLNAKVWPTKMCVIIYAKRQ